ncbi:hypothetical protein [Parasitella parasitica]|uniref:Uncharacterized protein n=1 Tax=Parasitella parasitica TaxID=35722 RepID=A0A0B7NMB7_9FUNG|nr:hypothetical protein [Parasitella parasitica]
MTIDRDNLSASSLIMKPLYEQLLAQKFTSSADAIEFCREACHDYGFPIKHETNANRSIYIYCSHETLSDGLEQHQQQQQTPPLRKRPSSLKNAATVSPLECKWRIVLSENEMTNEWTFRKSLNPQASEHSHMLDDNEPSIWPQEVYERIIQLARQKSMQIEEIRDSIKLQFPDITWNDRRFLNHLMEERKRMSQKSVTDKVQRLVMASTRLCSVVAANEDWASCVEGELVKMLENYKHLLRIPSQQMVDSNVDLQLDMIHSEIDKNKRPTAKQQHQDDDMFGKKRRANPVAAAAALRNEGVQVMSVPSCTLYIRSQPLRSLSEPSSQSRRAFNDLIAASSVSAIPQQHQHQHQLQQQHHHQQQQQQQPHHHHHHHQQHQHPNIPFAVNSVFPLTSPVSSSSSTSSLQQRVDYNAYRNNNSNDMLQSPPIPESTNMMMPSNYNGGNDAYAPHPPAPSSNYNGPVSAATGDINFNFDPNTMSNTTPSYPQHVPASPAPIMIHRPHQHPHQHQQQQPQQHQQQQPNAERMAGYPSSMGYYSNTSSSIGRDSPPSTTSIQQRIMLQQEYEHQRQLQQMESSSAAVAAAAVANVHLPLIRSNSPLSTNMVQHQQQHPGSNLNPNHSQNWS